MGREIVKDYLTTNKYVILCIKAGNKLLHGFQAYFANDRTPGRD